jgi:hypothetical protein
MAGEIGNRLRFQNGRIDGFKAYQSAIGPIHDSRSGAAVMYRYGPRPIAEDQTVNGGPPVVHLSIVERMLHGCDNYAPVMLPASAKVLLPNGDVMPLTEDETREKMKSAYQHSAKAQAAPGAVAEAAAKAFDKMSKPDPEMVELARDTVWWRRFAYFSLLVAFALLAAWPWAAEWVVSKLSGPTAMVQGGGFNLLTVITWLDYCVGAVVGPIADLVLGFLPSYAQPWLKIAVYYPTATTIVVALVLYTWRKNSYLRDRIQERARLAWNRPAHMPVEDPTGGFLLRRGRWMRENAGGLRRAFTNYALPGVFLLLIFGGAALATSRSFFNWLSGTGKLCDSAGSVRIVRDDPLSATNAFDTKELCWGSGLWVEKGRKYRILIDARGQEWFDQTIMSGVNGFKLNDFTHIIGWPLRRWYAADWFQPVLRIGAEGDAELPLEAINVMPADALPRPLNPTDLKDKEHKKPVRVEEVGESSASLRDALKMLKPGAPIPKELLPDARKVWLTQGLANQMVAEFVAGASGEVFLYVNDAVVPVWPFFKPFYDNNSGTAGVTMLRMPLPPSPGK